MITIVTVLSKKHKTIYDHVWVNNLYNQIKKNITIPYKFICITNLDKDLFLCDVKIPKTNYGGWWSKIEIYNPQHYETDMVLYLDLDTFVASNIDWIYKYNNLPITFSLWNMNGVDSSILYFNIKYFYTLYFEYNKFKNYCGDQDLLRDFIKQKNILSKNFSTKEVDNIHNIKKPNTPSIIKCTLIKNNQIKNSKYNWILDI